MTGDNRDSVFEGNVAWVFPDHFDVDLIIGVQNVRGNDIDSLVPVCMNAYEENFAASVTPGDIFVGGRNFAYGHAHPQSMMTVRRTGINVILAESFAPAFYRGELNNGMALLQVPGITKKASRHDRLRVEFVKGLVHNVTTGETIQGVAPSPIAVELVEGGGYRSFILKRLEEMPPR